MKLTLLPQALADIDHIETYFAQHSETAALNVLDDVFSTFEMIQLHPHIGHSLKRHGLQKIVTAKYRFVVVYKAEEFEIVIDNIFRQQNR